MSRISDWQILNRKATTTLSVRTTVSLKNLQAEMDEGREKVLAYLHHIDEYPAGSFFVIYHSFSKKEVDMESGFPVSKELPGEEDIEPSVKPGGLYLSAYHLGAYQEVPKVYQEMDVWLKENHFETTGESEEIYLNEGVDTNQLLTQILIPIQLEDRLHEE